MMRASRRGQPSTWDNLPYSALGAFSILSRVKGDPSGLSSFRITYRNYVLCQGLTPVGSFNQVWCADISYIPLRRGFLYLVAIMDWFSRKILSWRLSNTMDTDFCVDALEDALARYGKPEIFNTDQGSQFTSEAFTNVLKDANVRISMDGKGRWRDNIMIERLWRSLKYECIYLHAFETPNFNTRIPLSVQKNRRNSFLGFCK